MLKYDVRPRSVCVRMRMRCSGIRIHKYTHAHSRCASRQVKRVLYLSLICLAALEGKRRTREREKERREKQGQLVEACRLESEYAVFLSTGLSLSHTHTSLKQQTIKE